jgi:NAD+ kinase
METFRTVALIGKYKSPEIAGPLLDLARFLENRGRSVVVDPLTASYIGDHCPPVLSLQDIGDQADLAIVIGGDGTMLNIARTLAPHDVALVGVNLGRLGFLTDVSMDGMFETFDAMLAGHYVVEERMLLASEVWREEARVLEVTAFNDVSVIKGAHGSLIELEVRVNGQYVHDLRADGLIVVSAECRVEILMRSAADARAHFDSHSHCELRHGDRVLVRRCPDSIRLLHPSNHDYYHMLREKMHWSKTPGR